MPTVQCTVIDVASTGFSLLRRIAYRFGRQEVASRADDNENRRRVKSKLNALTNLLRISARLTSRVTDRRLRDP